MFGAMCWLPILGIVPASLMAQRLPVNLGTAGDYVVLSKTGITNVPPSPIVGNIGASPITGAAVHVTCAEVTGTIQVVDAAGPAPCSVINPLGLTVAILDMQTAYTDAAGRTVPDFTEFAAGNISGRTLTPGLYKWSTSVLADATGFTLSGGPNAVWIFQVAGDITLANGAKAILAGGAQANNIFWQVAGPTGVTLGTGAIFNGTILSSKQVIMNTGAALNGRALAQTQVTLQSTAVTTPGPLVGGIPIPVAPTVTSTAPANLAVGASISSLISATFSEIMDPATISGLTFTLKNGLTSVLGTVSYVGLTATFTPGANLLANTVYTGTITTGAKDPAGIGLTSNYIWNFTTGAAPDITPPTVISTAPASGSVAVPTGSALLATFSEAMDPATITNVTFNLKQGLVPVAGSVIYVGVTGTFTPAASLLASTTYTATVTSGVKDLAGNAMASNYVWTFTTGAGPDITPPTVVSTTPTTGAVAVPTGNSLLATFSEAMDPTTITNVTFNLKQGLVPVAGSVIYFGVTGTFTPTASLLASTTYTATITTGVKDLTGNAMVANYVWTFTTGAGPDITPPTVSSTLPSSAATGVATSTALLATFSEAMDPTTVTIANFSLKQGVTPVAGTVLYAGLLGTFTPASSLAVGTTYTATITSGVKDLAGNAMVANYVWSFTTASAVVVPPVNTLPVVTSTVPANGAVLVTMTTNISANFNKPMDPLTVTAATFTVLQGTTTVAGTVSYAGGAAMFRPTTNLLPGIVYSVQLSSGVRDLAGNSLTNYQWSFTTGTSTGQSPICIANFAVLAGTAVVASGSNSIFGDVGSSPGSSVTGFAPGTIKGTVHAGDAFAARAMVDLNNAYADAVARSAGPVTLSANIGGQTFTAGLYQSGSSLDISSAPLTLDAKGDINAVFIFQIPSGFTTATNQQTILTGGANAANVFWQVGSSAFLGTNSTFKGSILAAGSITLNAGATVEGRLLARSGTVTLQGNAVASPPPFIGFGGIVNAASDAHVVAAGSIAAVFGNSLSSATVSASNYPLLTLGGSTFQVGTLAAPIFMVSCGQANVQIPWEIAGQTQAAVTATAGGVTSTVEPATVAPFAPGIFSVNQSGSGQGAVEIAATAQLAAPLGFFGNRPVRRGEYIAIYGTGFGPVTNQPATGAPALAVPLSWTTSATTATIGGMAAEVTFSGLVPGLTGLYQVNALVPAGAPIGDQVQLVVRIGGVNSNTVTIAVQ